ncbi:MAG TPA: acyltransferase [Bacteroidales bacterium]|nr:acyltransferase [Bacteroidales bacterium]HPT09250.1 acyltransferase [Bacteroidales bacterium]
MEIQEHFSEISSDEGFTRLALETFRYQYQHNPVYQIYAKTRGTAPETVQRVEDIPFLPIEFFRSHTVYCGEAPPQAVFLSSGTTAPERSRHRVADLNTYRHALLRGFTRFYGPPENFQFLALTPTPEQRPDSSLVFMIQTLMDQSLSPENGYFLTSPSGLTARLRQRRPPEKKVMLIGLTHALLKFAEEYQGDYSPLTVVETGGMKGFQQEITREELHASLSSAFGVEKIHSEYGMTELLSQAWSSGDGLFSTPPWMKVFLREINDPFAWAETGQTGGINIVDLANRESCSFIATQDLGRFHPDGLFEVLGRFQASDARGCSLMI